LRGAEQGFLLLTSNLGNPDRKVLTVPQLRLLAQRVRKMEMPEDRELTGRDLIALGYGGEMAQRIVSLLDEEELLEYYLRKGAKAGCLPITRVSVGYPALLKQRLGLDAPGCLWAKGDLSLLGKPMIALVGSRELREQNREFACQVGIQAARQGYVLVSGNARGADRTAQDACRNAGGQVIIVVADSLCKKQAEEGVLFLSEDCYDAPFTAQRALSRNRVIHALTDRVFVAQCTHGAGGTWDGTTKNLQAGWSGVFCFDDNSAAVAELIDRGALPVFPEQLGELESLCVNRMNFFDQ